MPTDPAPARACRCTSGSACCCPCSIAGVVALLVHRLWTQHLRITDVDETLLDMSILGGCRSPAGRGRRGSRGLSAAQAQPGARRRAGSEFVVMTSARPGQASARSPRASSVPSAWTLHCRCHLGGPRRSGAGPILAGSHTEPMLGLAQFMAGTGMVHDIAVGIHSSGATVIPAGSAPSDAAARLRPERFSELVDHLLQTHDWVLVDGPPVEGYADSLLLASRARADAARRRFVARARTFERRRCAAAAVARRRLAAGVVLNKAQAPWTSEPGRSRRWRGGVVAISGRAKASAVRRSLPRAAGRGAATGASTACSTSRAGAQALGPNGERRVACWKTCMISASGT